MARAPSPSGRSAVLPESLTMLPTSILRAGCVTDSHNTKFTLRSHNEEEIQDVNRLGNCLCRPTDGGIKIPGWNGRVDAAEERAGMTLDAARLVGEGQVLHVTTGPATSYWKTDAMASASRAMSL